MMQSTCDLSLVFFDLIHSSNVTSGGKKIVTVNQEPYPAASNQWKYAETYSISADRLEIELLIVEYCFNIIQIAVSCSF
jgi:hypothetical protein